MLKRGLFTMPEQQNNSQLSHNNSQVKDSLRGRLVSVIGKSNAKKSEEIKNNQRFRT